MCVRDSSRTRALLIAGLIAIPNLHTIQTLTSQKAAAALDKALSNTTPERTTPLNILIQINTSGEDSKSGLDPLTAAASTDVGDSEVGQLAKYIITSCPRLHFQGLMTIGALEQSLHASELEKNADFETLKATRDALHAYLEQEDSTGEWKKKWGAEGRLVLSMGMSSDFEAALKAGSDIVRVGTGIFGERRKKVEA